MATTTTSNKLEDQAAAAALHSHKDHNSSSVLDSDGKLSSASAAMSLKYANAQDLPSFPSHGLKMSSAGAAATLADSNKKPFEHWKPSAIPAANKAALLAKDYEMDPLWQPELSAAGSKAALLAHRDGATVEIWKSQGSAEGQSAAGQAALKTKSPNAIVDRELAPDGRRKALMAATGAMSGNRPRAGSVPQKGVHDGWAMKAANKSHQEPANAGPFTTGDPGFEAARVQNLAKNNTNRQLYGSTPPVAIEVEEKNHNDSLRASAVAMAQKMYAIQQTHIDQASGTRGGDSRSAAISSHARNPSDGSSEGTSAAPMRYENLEEAARKLAQERLSKLHDEHAEYRQYYGATSPPPRSRLSMRLRRRASAGDKDDDSSDEERSRRIRKEMSMFRSKLAEVDNKKRQADRDALLEAAHRNVEARLAKMDDKVFRDTGKASPAQKELWERQARERAQKSVDEAMVNVGKVHIGGGKYLDQSEVDAIARARLKPTLDEINDTAEKQRARDEEIRLEHERQQEQLAKEKAREAEVNAELKAARDAEKQEQKAKREEEKQTKKEQEVAEREQRQAEAAAEKERARLEKEEKRKSKEAKPGRFASILGRGTGAPGENETTAPTAAAPGTTPATEATSYTIHANGGTVHDEVTVPTAEAPNEATRVTSPVATSHDSSTPATTTAGEAPASPTKRDSKVKSWFKSRMRGTSKGQKEESADGLTTVPSEDVDRARESSIRDVAMAGRETDDMYGTNTSEEQPVSPVREADVARASGSTSISSFSSSDEAAGAKQSRSSKKSGKKGLKARLLGKMKSNKDGQTSEPVGNTTDDEDFQEARDKFEEEKLAPPAAPSNRPASPRLSHDRSRFTEEL